MTNLGLAWLQHLETKRSNVTKEKETERSNRVKEVETERSNRVREAETMRSNLVSEKETERHNRAAEGLTKRGQDFTKSTAERGQDLSFAASMQGHAVNATNALLARNLDKYKHDTSLEHKKAVDKKSLELTERDVVSRESSAELADVNKYEKYFNLGKEIYSMTPLSKIIGGSGDAKELIEALIK